MSDGRLPLTIPVQPWFRDHCFGGRVILPAVETMLLLAARAASLYPSVDIKVMEEVRFAKFLEIPQDLASVNCLVECWQPGDGRLGLKLLSRIQGRMMSRIKEHGEVYFSWPNPAKKQAISLEPGKPQGAVREITADYIYRHLVPFGPSYRTLKDKLFLSKDTAWGILEAPQLQMEPVRQLLGSPFPLDGALHAACVLGRQSVDFVPFPVGFAKRVVIRPTRPGCRYLTKVRRLNGGADELIFDLIIFDRDDRLYESISGLRMRDVSGAIAR